MATSARRRWATTVAMGAMLAGAVGCAMPGPTGAALTAGSGATGPPSSPNAATQPTSPTAPTETTLIADPQAAVRCSGGVSGFSSSIAEGAVGEPTPFDAVKKETASSGAPGHGVSAADWLVIPQGTQQVWFLSADRTVLLSTSQMADNQTWLVDSGQYCDR